MDEYDILRCPVCSARLKREGGSLVCLGEGARHCYDLASSGYVNLLPPGKGKNARTGDEKNMIAARCAFLETGSYLPISEKLGEIITECCLASCRQDISIVDAGCGEGYHTCNLIKALSANGIKALALGFDASKYGAAAAAKRARRSVPEGEGACGSRAHFAAGNIFNLPVNDSSVDFALSMFAPVAGKEAYRFLKPDGRFIIVSAGKRHLYELRELLYEHPRLPSGDVKIPDGFETEAESEITFTFSAEGNQTLTNLFVMTPFYYKTSLADKAKLKAVDRLDITANVKYTVLKKKK